jgi:acyl carrier protein
VENRLDKLIYDTLNEIIEVLPKIIKFEENNDTPLYGGEGQLDSLGLVTFLINLEQKIEDELNIEITIASEKAMSQKNSPFRTIGSLIDYLNQLINK